MSPRFANLLSPRMPVWAAAWSRIWASTRRRTICYPSVLAIRPSSRAATTAR